MGQILGLNVVRHVVKVDGDGLLVEKLDALDTYLGVLRLVAVLIFLRLLEHSRLVNAASLVGFIDLCHDYLVQANTLLLFIFILVRMAKIDELLHHEVLNSRYLNRLKKSQLYESSTSRFLILLLAMLRITLPKIDQIGE